MNNSRIEHILDTEVVYMRRVGQYGAENYTLMERMKSWAAKCGLLTEDAVIYAIALDNPQSVAPEKCRYDVCLQTTGTESVVTDDQVSRRILSGGNYAVFKIEHTANAAYSSFCRVFLSSRYSIAQIAWWISLLLFWDAHIKVLPLPRSLKRSGALLGSNSMRNRIVQDDKHEQEWLSTRLLLFHV